MALLPRDTSSYRRMARCLSLSGELEAALLTLEAALRIDPEHAETHRMLATGLEASGRLDRARHHLDRAHSLEKRQPA